jgi:hypothetical protein
MSIEQKIRALSLKTVQNGASEAEAEAAIRMIERLRGVSNFEQLRTKPKQYADGQYNNIPIEDVDWDVVAQENLNRFQHADYVYETSEAWERYNKTRLNLGPAKPMSLHEYRHTCHDVFRRLFDRIQIK